CWAVGIWAGGISSQDATAKAAPATRPTAEATGFCRLSSDVAQTRHRLAADSTPARRKRWPTWLPDTYEPGTAAANRGRTSPSAGSRYAGLPGGGRPGSQGSEGLMCCGMSGLLGTGCGSGQGLAARPGFSAALASG